MSASALQRIRIIRHHRQRAGLPAPWFSFQSGIALGDELGFERDAIEVDDELEAQQIARELASNTSSRAMQARFGR